MSIESLQALKDRYKANGRPNFGTEVLNVVIDEVVSLDVKMDVLDARVDVLDTKMDELEGRIQALEG